MYVEMSVPFSNGTVDAKAYSKVSVALTVTDSNNNTVTINGGNTEDLLKLQTEINRMLSDINNLS